MTDLDWLPPADQTIVVPTPRRHRHVWEPRWQNLDNAGTEIIVTACKLCPAIRDEVKARRGKNSRDYGNRAELAVARKYGGVKVGHAGGPVDVRGAEFNVQVKTHRRPPPAEWRKAFGGMNANLERIPRLLLRFVQAGGQPPDDYFVIRADDWLRWFGRDE